MNEHDMNNGVNGLVSRQREYAFSTLKSLIKTNVPSGVEKVVRDDKDVYQFEDSKKNLWTITSHTEPYSPQFGIVEVQLNSSNKTSKKSFRYDCIYGSTPYDWDDNLADLLNDIGGMTFAVVDSDTEEVLFTGSSNQCDEYVESHPRLYDVAEIRRINKSEKILENILDEYNHQERDTYIPAPYNKYYEIAALNDWNDGALAEGEIPEAFNNYLELTVLAKVYAKEQYEDALASNCLDCVWLVCDEVGKQLLVTAVNDRVYPLTLEEVVDCVGLNEADAFDDYEDGIVESVEMSDAQRLALQELDAALDCGELDPDKHALAYQIQWDINFEDVILFINGVGIDLKDIKHVAYGDCDGTEFDGCYSVTLHNGEVKRYCWHDFDMTGSLTCIDCNEGLLGNLMPPAMNPMNLLASYDVNDGWDKPFDWTERYVKDGFVIYNNYQGSWHLEQIRPNTKHIGNYKSLEAAKAAGDKEIAAKSAKNRDKKPQWGVHQFSTKSVIFRGTEEECANYINDNELWDDAEVYMILPDDPYYRNLEEDYARVDAKDFVKHPMNYDVTSMLDFEVQDDVKIYIHRGPGRQREFYIVIGDTYVDHSFSKLETVENYLRRKHLVKEVISESFKPGDVVYVTVANKQGRVTKMVSPDVVEVEIDDFMNPVRIDRFYTDEVELIQSDFDEGLLDKILDPLNII